MTPPDDIIQEERENLLLVEHLRTLYDTRTQDEQALQAIGARLAASLRPIAQDNIPWQSRRKLHHLPGRAGFPFSLRPKAGAFTLMVATLVVVLLIGSFAVMAMALHYLSSATGASSAHGLGTPAAQTPCPQASSDPQIAVSGTITRVVLRKATLGTATTVGFIEAKGPKGQYRGQLGGDFKIHILKETRVFEQQQKGCHPVPLTSLKVGQRIQVQFGGVVMQSLPPQIVAEQLVIVADGGSGS